MLRSTRGSLVSLDFVSARSNPALDRLGCDSERESDILGGLRIFPAFSF
jgi:hypothetical protein